MASRRGNDGYVSNSTRKNMRAACRSFLDYVNVPITNNAMTNLVNLKKQNPNSTKIELVLKQFQNEQPIKLHRNYATYILGIFKANFAPLQIRVYNHFVSKKENCTEGILKDIYNYLTPEQKDLIQWIAYINERAKASYGIPFEQIDISRPDYAIINFEHQKVKTRFDHFSLAPVNFVKRVIDQAKTANRKSPFPNYQSLWKEITRFAEQEYHVMLTSNYLRKRFQTIAENTSMPENHWEYLRGSTQKVGHANGTYSLKFIETLIIEYDIYLVHELDLSNDPLIERNNSSLDKSSSTTSLHSGIKQLVPRYSP